MSATPLPTFDRTRTDRSASRPDAGRASSTLAALVASVREVVAPSGPASAGTSPAAIAESVAACLRRHLPLADVLTAEQRRGDPAGYTQHVLHVEPGGSFSVVALVWLPGQVTPIHDHVCWCVVGVLEGLERETVYRLTHAGADAHLVETGRRVNEPGSVSAFAPPGDIHRVGNSCDDTAVSLHVYGADIGVLGTSVRRCYDLPVH